MKQIVLVAGGSPKYWPDMSQYGLAETIWIGVDRGAWFLLEADIIPDLAVGDFDSLTASEFDNMSLKAKKVITAPAEKDETDTQLGLELASEIAGNLPIILIGATGGRMDHLMANVWLMLEPRFAHLLSRFSLRDNQNTMSFYQPGDYHVDKEPDKPYIGFLCVTPVNQLTLKGFKYPLDNYQVDFPVSFASNEFLAERGEFSFSSGQVIVVQSKDK